MPYSIQARLLATASLIAAFGAGAPAAAQVIDHLNGSNNGGGYVIDNTTTQFQVTGGTATRSGVISEDAPNRPLEKIGAGTLVLTGANTYNGLTTISGGALQIGAGGTSGQLSGPVSISLGSSLIFDRSDPVSFNRVISGAGRLVQQGAGTLSLGGINTFSGGTTIDVGSQITVMQNGALGSGAITLYDASRLEFGLNTIIGNDIVLNGGTSTLGGSATTITGAMSGAGNLGIASGGNLLLSGANTMTGAITNAGLLQLGLTGSIEDASYLDLTGTGSLVIAGGGSKTVKSLRSADTTTAITLGANTLTVSAGDGAAAFAGRISGSGGLRIAGGQQILSGTSTYTGGTIVDPSAILDVTSGGAVGTGSVALGSNAHLYLDSTVADFTLGNLVTGAGGANKLGGNTVVMTGDNTFTGTTVINSGTLQIGSGGTSGLLSSGQVVIAPGATLAFNRSDNSTFGGLFSITTGSLVKSGNGTLFVTGGGIVNNVAVNGGTLSYGNGGAGGLVQADVAVASGATLAFNRTTDVTFFNTISGSGALTKAGAGTLTLTGGNTFNGATSVTGGVLSIGDGGTNGALFGNIDVSAGATVQFNRSDSYGYTGVVSGAGTGVKLGAGTLTLTGDNTIANVQVSAGALRIGAGGTTGSISGNLSIASGASAVFSRSNDSSYNGSASGAGTMTKQGAGTLTVNGSIDVGAVTVEAGTLRVAGLAGSLNASPVNVQTGATLAFNRGVDITHAGAVSGGGALSKLGSGTLTLTGANTHTGGTTISGGALSVGGGGTTGSLAGDVINNSDLTFNRSDSLTFAGAVSGTGTLTKVGAGTLTLTGANTYAGLTHLDVGGLQIGAGGTTGSVAGNIRLGSSTTVTFNRSDDTAYGGIVGGTGTVIKSGAGVLSLTGAVYASNASVNAGTLSIGAGGTSGEMTTSATVAAGATLMFNRSDASTYQGQVTGAGALVKAGAGVLTLVNPSFNSGGVSITGGTLQFDTGGSVSSNIAVSSGATVAFNRTGTVSNVISGAGGLSKLGTGTLSLTGLNTYTGPTTVSGGTLQIGSGGTAGSIAGPVAVSSGATLAFNRSDTVTHGGVVSGAGGLTKLGAGTLILSGTNTYTGATTVSAGTLRVNGAQGGSAVTVASGATLGGSGTVGATTVSSGGTLAAGNSIGTLNVAGSLTLASGSNLAVELDPTASDRVIASGAVTLGGTVTATYAAGGYVAKRYDIVTGSSVSGTFSGLTNVNLPDGFKSEVKYDATNAYIDLALAYQAMTGLPDNPQAASDAITDFFNRTGGIDAQYASLTAEQLTEVDGEAGASNIGLAFDGLDTFVGDLFDTAPNRSGEAKAVAQPWTFAGPVWSAWGDYDARSTTTAGRASVDSRRTDAHSNRAILGADKAVSDRTLLGVALSQGQGRFSVAGAGGGQGEADILQVGLYGRQLIGGASYLAGALAYASQDSTIAREVTATSAGSLRSEVKTTAWAARLEGGVRVALSNVTGLTPYVSLQSTLVKVPAYAETATSGSADFAVAYAATDIDSVRTEAGFKIDSRRALSDGRVLTLFARGAAVFQSPDYALDAAFVALPGSTFTVRAAEGGRDRGLLGLGASLSLQNGLTVGAQASTESGGGFEADRAQLTVRKRW